MINTQWHTHRRRLISGILILVPFGVTLLVVFWLFGLIKRFLRPLVGGLFNSVAYLPSLNEVHPIALTGLVYLLTFLLLAVVVYLIGNVGTKVLGKRLLTQLDGWIQKIPLAGTLYGATKQVLTTFAGEDRPTYESVVMVEFPRPGFKAIGFLTGHVTGEAGERLATVFIPTAPNPTTGFFQLVPAAEVRKTGLTVEEAFKMILSVGLISPKNMAVLSHVDTKTSTT